MSNKAFVGERLVISRYDSPGQVYLAFSSAQQMWKIGWTLDLRTGRLDQLRRKFKWPDMELLGYVRGNMTLEKDMHKHFESRSRVGPELYNEITPYEFRMAAKELRDREWKEAMDQFSFGDDEQYGAA